MKGRSDLGRDDLTPRASTVIARLIDRFASKLAPTVSRL